MSLVVKVIITGDERVKQKLKRLGSSLYDFRQAMDEIGRQGQEYFAGPAWLSQGGVFGNKWPGLSAKYAARKAKKYPGRGPLVRTETMRRSFTHNSDRMSVVITNEADYFKYHQSTLSRTKIPRRQMIGINSAFKSLARGIIQREVQRKIRTA